MTETPTNVATIETFPECRANWGIPDAQHLLSVPAVRMGYDDEDRATLVDTDPTLPPEGYGRGAWTRYGMPSQVSVRTYLMTADKPYVGAEQSKSHSHLAVNRGAKALQFLMNEMGVRNSAGNRIAEDGTLGTGTAKAIKSAQTRLGLKADGIAGYNTLRAILAPYSLTIEQENRIPDRLVFGLMGQESGFDPGAIGYTTPSDHGLIQINLAAHASIALDDAMHPEFALTYAAARMRRAYVDFKAEGATERLAWDCAIAQHNSPMLAAEWAATGVAPVVATRADGNQIADYVAKVRAFGAAAPA